ncbi:carboxyl transferase domain-containing protein [Gephyromycinifex aptenodytis]|uniref:carboxyl transferase domain-containing protein n=1 Tax=Gephyromycinifex aptenodytis TaxID=2716227 RepID=UPI001447FA36|nr:carboxyl transferase domain-containing protein [Gephyromycinifex aptenodytis]
MSTVFIANRGEIAVRLERAAAELGMRSVAVFTRAERDAPHTRLADEAHLLPGEGAAAYLSIPALVEVATASGCDIVAPGYGFLSENAQFAAACEQAGLAFAGPTPAQLDLFGDKSRARDLAREHGVPVLPATTGPTTLEQAHTFFAEHGGEGVVVKAIAGGGGRGMRVVTDAAELPQAYDRASSEALRAFGNGDVYLERLVGAARHIEAQVLGDGTGAVVHLHDRDCSLQRRHQKLIEIAPAPGLPESTRTALLDAALRMARAQHYRGLGTFEFLLDVATGEFVFIEANPRLQVEHTVTEEVTGLDLVALSLRVAAGATLADLHVSQERIPTPRGVAVQARVNAETLLLDGSVRPAHGRLEPLALPAGPGVRVDTGVEPGTLIGSDFDSLLAKVITHTTGRASGLPENSTDSTALLPTALEKTRRALAGLSTGVVATNAGLLSAILAHPDVRAGVATTRFVDQHLTELLPAAQTGADSPTGQDAQVAAGVIATPLSGTLIELAVAPGQSVTRGQVVAVVEAMKMEHPLLADAAGTVTDARGHAGDAVEAGTVLVRIDPDPDAGSEDDADVEQDLDEVRADLHALRERKTFTADQARPDAIAKRHGIGMRTARENLEHLLDPDSLIEYGGLAVAAQRRRKSMEELIATTPADGIVTGVGRIGSQEFGPDASRVAVLAYDYTVLAGTQGYLNHKKTDRLLHLAYEQRLPVVLFAEGGGGRPGDTDTTVASGLDVPTFTAMGRLSGRVPTVGIAAGRCFAGNAALLGCCDVVIATANSSIGMGGPAMIAGGGLGSFAPEEVGPIEVQSGNGVVDVAVADEAEAVQVARRYLSYTQGPVADWAEHDQRRLRFVVPENRVRAYDVREAIHLLADVDSVLELRAGFGQGIITTFARIEGRPLGIVANNPRHLGGALDRDAADKLARFLRLCDAYGLPVVSLCDTPGFMVGPDAERTATVRHFARLFVLGAHLRIPVLTVVLRKAYGLGAMAMAAGSFATGPATVSWPTGEVGGMGLEGAVRLGFAKELAAVADPVARQELFEKLLADLYERGRAANAAAVVEIDDVIDPIDTRRWITTALPPRLPLGGAGFIDTW